MQTSLCCASAAAQKAANDPAKQALLAKKEDLEQKIDALKYQKAAMDPADYKQQLTAALVQLAQGPTGTGQMNWCENRLLLLADGARQYEPLRPSPADACHCASTASRQKRKPAMSRWCAARLLTIARKATGGLKQYDQANEQFRIATPPPDSEPSLQGPLGNAAAPAVQQHRCGGPLPGSAAERSQKCAGLFRARDCQRGRI